MTESTFELVHQSSAVQQIAKAEIDSQISTAKQYPRDIAKVKRDMLAFATLDQETAESCFYTLPRGGKNIQGPSVRLAEIAVSCYGNLRAAVRILETVTTGNNPHVVLQAVCHDLEKNVAVNIEKRRRITKKKMKDTIDEDDINLAANAGSAIAFRDAVFKIVPGALIKPVYEQVIKVAIGDAKSLNDRRARAVETIAKMGVSKERIFAAVGRTSIETIDLTDLETLFGLHTAVKEGQTSLDDAFPEKQEAPKFVAAKEPVKSTTTTPAAKPQMAKFNTPGVAAKEAEPAPLAVQEKIIPLETATTPAAETTDASELGPVSEAAPEADKSFEEMVDTATESPELIAMRAAMVKHEVTDAMIINFASQRALFKPEVHGKPAEELKLTDLMESKIPTFTKNILAAGQMLKTIKAS
jgi:hypothetical protein